jgi:hypothetical protein
MPKKLIVLLSLVCACFVGCGPKTVEEKAGVSDARPKTVEEKAEAGDASAQAELGLMYTGRRQRHRT